MITDQNTDFLSNHMLVIKEQDKTLGINLRPVMDGRLVGLRLGLRGLSGRLIASYAIPKSPTRLIVAS